MSGQRSLAIVIPAYKAAFLEAALRSVAAQTDRDFHVYVGDDASPDDLGAICARWQGRLPLSYHRFDTNLGAGDLTAQWARCIQLSQEPWVWLFSDDDEMAPNCVEAWQAQRRLEPLIDVFHFDVHKIDAAGRVFNTAKPFPPLLSSRQFALRRLQMDLSSYAPDYLFRRSTWIERGGFQSFPLAWCSDDATWIKLASAHGIRTVPGAHVRWRFSGSNLSSPNPALAEAKTEACVAYLEWLDRCLPALERSDHDPDDLQIMSVSPYWLFEQIHREHDCFGPARAMRYARRLGRVRGHGQVNTLLRWMRNHARWWAARRTPSGGH